MKGMKDRKSITTLAAFLAIKTGTYASGVGKSQSRIASLKEFVLKSVLTSWTAAMFEALS